MIGTTVTVSQQYLLASKVRSKLLKCASTEKNKDYDLRILVGHANLLDKLMDSIDTFTQAQRQDTSAVSYLSSDEEEDEAVARERGQELSEESGSESEEDEEDEVADSFAVFYGSTPRYAQSEHFSTIWEEEEQAGYVPLRLSQKEEYDDEESEDSDMEQDLSMMPISV
ncbi:ECM13 (YBL043W) and YJR115W [Zygosaccharomyces parabailii]|nr:ECM13 (YBL043W) and YJR115W [Zygosaccharomyces parabailii]CDH11494.1 uncharacterized protein ZBAI_03280 [Zygosaccharomyces bailii ISA1307]